MRFALLLVCVLTGATLAPAAALAVGEDPVARTAPSLWQGPRLLAQRQPGGLPGRSDIDEEARPGAKQLPGTAGPGAATHRACHTLVAEPQTAGAFRRRPGTDRRH